MPKDLADDLSMMKQLYAEAGAHRLILAPALERKNAERVLERMAKDYLP